MSSMVYDLIIEKEFKKAGSNDLIKMVPVADSHSLYMPKYILVAMTEAIVHRERCHLSGPTGSGKSALLLALQVPENLRLLCHYLGFEYKPLEVFDQEMADLDTAGELHKTKEIRDNNTETVLSELYQFMIKADKNKDSKFFYVHARELGRVHSSSIMSGLLEPMSTTKINIPGYGIVDGNSVGFFGDSNYQSMNSPEHQHTLVEYDSALDRRFTVKITMDYLSEEEEFAMMNDILSEQFGKVNKPLLEMIIRLGHVIRQYRSEGSLLSVSSPIPSVYTTAYRMANRDFMDTEIVFQITLLGHAQNEDQKLANSIIQNVLNSRRNTKDQYNFLEDSF